MPPIITKVYSPEQAGERVGWVNVQNAPGDSPFVLANIVVATVGEGGAEYGYVQAPGGEILYGADNEVGFLAVAGLTMAISRDENIDMHGTEVTFRSAQNGDDGAWILRKGALGNPNVSPSEVDKSWEDNPTDLLEQLKQELETHGVKGAYPTIYYSLNSMLGHKQYHDKSTARDIDPRDLFLIDKSMAETSTAQAAIADTIASDFDRIIEEDRLMKRRLTAFTDISVEDLPETFAESRRTVARREHEILVAKGRLHAPKPVYLPVGYRPDGRTWPYMDPTALDEQNAFGRELQALKGQDISLADHELAKELGELTKRRQYALHGGAVLHVLAKQEETIEPPF